jgi:hypothetical protein
VITPHRTKRSATPQPLGRRFRARLAVSLAPLALVAGMLLPAVSATGAATDPVTDAAGTIIPPDLNAHVDPWCADPGSSGARVEMLLVEEDVLGGGRGELDATSRAAFITEMREEARFVDDAFALASAESGGPNGKRIRWAHEAGGGCTVMVRPLVVPVGTVGATAPALMAAIKQAYPGLITPNRIYIGFTTRTSFETGRCGQATMAGNQLHNDGREAQIARVDFDCRRTTSGYDSTTLHELVHALGATYPGAPGTTGDGHCNDGPETLCAPGINESGNPACGGAWVIDCGKDTYFNTNPATGTYLANPANWNIANSPFLANVAQLPAAPAAAVTFNKSTAPSDEVVTATVQTEPGAWVQWQPDLCDYTGASKTATADSNGRATFTIQCYDPSYPTVHARVWRAGQKTVTRAQATMTYTAGPVAAATVTGPTSAAPGQQVTLTANTVAPGEWTYEWFAAQEGCGLPVEDMYGTVAGVKGQSVTFACDGSLSSTRFFAKAVRAQDGKIATGGEHNLAITTTTPPTGALDVRLMGSLLATGGATFTLSGSLFTSNATVSDWSWSASHGCTVTPLAADRSVANVTCPAATNAVVTATATAIATDGRTGSGSHQITVTPAPTPPPPITSTDPTTPTNPTNPTSARGTTTDLSVDASGKNTVFAVTARTRSGAPLAGQRVAIETRPRTGGAYTTTAWLTTGASGTATATVAATQSVFARAQLPGDASYAASVSREVSVSAMIVVKAAKWGSKGLTATVKTTGGTPAGRVALAVEKKAGRKWKKVTSATTNARGVVKVKMKVKTKTVFRFVASDTATHRADTSSNVTLKS